MKNKINAVFVFSVLSKHCKELSMALQPINKGQLAQMLEKVGSNEQQRRNLQSLVSRYNEAIFQLGELKRNLEWKLILEPDTFKG